MTCILEQRFDVPKAVLMREVAGESVLLNLDSETYFGLNEVGTRMWQKLNEGLSLEQACVSLLEEYAVEPDVLRADMQRLVEQLVSHGLLERHTT